MCQIKKEKDDVSNCALGTEMHSGPVMGRLRSYWSVWVVSNSSIMVGEMLQSWTMQYTAHSTSTLKFYIQQFFVFNFHANLQSHSTLVFNIQLQRRVFIFKLHIFIQLHTVCLFNRKTSNINSTSQLLFASMATPTTNDGKNQ